MVVLNCAAIPRDLIESEIFGHVKGAFTGAQFDREGAAARANGGTLFLDEICEMELDLQAKLLRFIQTGTFQKVGGSKLETVDVRFVCATNRDPFEEVKAGRFREDLYYRLHVIPVALPPLRERGEDVIRITSYNVCYTKLLRIKVIKEKKSFLLLSNLLLASFQKRIANKFDIVPGAEMIKAIEAGEAVNAEIHLARNDFV